MRYVVNSPVVVGEIIDDEAVILDLQSGRYFNTEASGAEIWAGIEAGETAAALAGRLVARFDVAAERAAEEVSVFLKVLEEHALVRAEPAEPGAAHVPAVPLAAGREPFRLPFLGIHSDLDDLLRLDPIHDVDQTGWPMAHPHAASGAATPSQ
jgi:hypothetical protein